MSRRRGRDKSSRRPSRAKRQGFGTRELYVLVAPGLEEALADELADLGLSGRIEKGGIAIQGGEPELRAIHLYSRIANQVRVRVARGRADNLDDVGRVIRSGPWSQFLHPTQPLQVKVATRGSRFRHRPPIAKKAEHAIKDALRGPRLPGPRPPREPAEIHVRLFEGKIIASIDASGEPLYKRGWRRDVGRAPIRENLAAAILRLAGWDPGMPLVDPMCGSGTFPIEAATIALGRPAGLGRRFAFERFPSHDAAAWRKLQQQARTEPLDLDAAILGGDREDGAILAARKNASRAHVDGRVELIQSTFHQLDPPPGRGLVVVNPPYGERVGKKSKVGAIYRDFGTVMKERWSGWQLAILLPSARHTGALDLPVEERAAFKNGSLPVHLFVGTIP